jgi:PAS domain S-box-containing protein
MEHFFRFTTPVIYWLLVIIWTFIFVFYIKKVKKLNPYNKLLKLLLFVLAIDAFRTLFESLYFGAWYTSLSGLIPIEIFNYLAQPQIVFFPKIINLIATILIFTLLIKKWLSSEITQNNELNTLIEKQTSEIRLINEDILKAKEKIEVSEEKFSKAFYDNALAMEIIDLKNGERLDFNNNFCKLTEYSKSELSKKGFGELQLIKEIDNQNELLNELTTKGFSNNKSLRIITKSGKLKNVILNASVLNIKDQKTAIISLVDITKQKEIEEKNIKLSAAVEQSPESIIITNKKGIIEYVNPHFTKLTGYSFEEVIGRNPNLLKSGAQDDVFYKDLWDTSGKANFRIKRRVEKSTGNMQA